MEKKISPRIIPAKIIKGHPDSIPFVIMLEMVSPKSPNNSSCIPKSKNNAGGSAIISIGISSLKNNNNHPANMLLDINRCC